MRTLIASIACLPLAAWVGDAGRDASSTAIATLKSRLGAAANFELDDMRVTDKGIACINYQLSNEQGVKTREHAVVNGNEVLRSSLDDKTFEKAWNEHCLGPRGGTGLNE